MARHPLAFPFRWLFPTDPDHLVFIIWPRHVLRLLEVKVGALSMTTWPKPATATEAMAAPNARASRAKRHLLGSLPSGLPCVSAPHPMGCLPSAGEGDVANSTCHVSRLPVGKLSNMPGIEMYGTDVRAVGRRSVSQPAGRRSISSGARIFQGICPFWKSSQAARFWKGKAGHRFQAKLRTGRPLLCWKPIHGMVTCLPSPHRGGGPLRGAPP